MKKKYIRPSADVKMTDGVPLLSGSEPLETGDASAAGSTETTDPKDPCSTWTQLAKPHSLWDDDFDDTWN